MTVFCFWIYVSNVEHNTVFTNTYTERLVMSEKSPTIVIRKGTTELQIRNAAAIIKKIDELYPNNDFWKKYNDEVTAEQRNKHSRWVASAKDWFKNEFFGGTEESFDVIVGEDKPMTDVPYKGYEDKPSVGNISLMGSEEKRRFQDAITNGVKQPTKTVNSNAYEIRLDILKEAIQFLSWKTECDKVNGQYNHVPSSDEALELANKFYKFVENRR